MLLWCESLSTSARGGAWSVFVVRSREVSTSQRFAICDWLCEHMWPALRKGTVEQIEVWASEVENPIFQRIYFLFTYSLFSSFWFVCSPSVSKINNSGGRSWISSVYKISCCYPPSQARQLMAVKSLLDLCISRAWTVTTNLDPLLFVPPSPNISKYLDPLVSIFQKYLDPPLRHLDPPWKHCIQLV